MISNLPSHLESMMVAFVTPENAVQLLATCSLARLRSACLRTIAQHLLQVVRLQRSELERLIVASAKEIEEREEFDSVPLVDDIRYHLDALHTDLRDALGLGFGEEDDCMEKLVEGSVLLQWQDSEPLWPEHLRPVY